MTSMRKCYITVTISSVSSLDLKHFLGRLPGYQYTQSASPEKKVITLKFNFADQLFISKSVMQTITSNSNTITGIMFVKKYCYLTFVFLITVLRQYLTGMSLFFTIKLSKPM